MSTRLRYIMFFCLHIIEVRVGSEFPPLSICSLHFYCPVCFYEEVRGSNQDYMAPTWVSVKQNQANFKSIGNDMVIGKTGENIADMILKKWTSERNKPIRRSDRCTNRKTQWNSCSVCLNRNNPLTFSSETEITQDPSFWNSNLTMVVVQVILRNFGGVTN
jgi:hypothetical protein